MKLIIDVNENYYNKLKTELKNSPDYPNLDYCQIIIASGTPVSNKGDLISRSALKEDFADMREGYPIFSDTEMLSTKDIAKIIDNAPTISPFKAMHDELHKGEEE